MKTGLAAALGLLCAACSAAADDDAARLVPISGGLGLADVEVLDPGARLQQATAVVRLRSGGQAAAPMHRRAGVWTARVMAGPGDATAPVEVELLITDAGEVRRTLLRASAEPAPGLGTPDWAKGAVWYQVFPERFRNGNPANDPRPPAVTPRPWGSVWSALSADELEARRARERSSEPPHIGRWRRGERGAVLVDRRYGGDLEGLAAKLDDLKDLGVTAIYLNPVFEAPSLHKYDASDFRHIDRTLAGPGSPLALSGETADPATWVWTASDRYFLDQLLPAARARRLRIVLDGVWNHVGLEFWAFRDVLARGADSPHAAWFDVRFAPATDDHLAALRSRHPTLAIEPGAVIGWQSWNGRNGTLPVFSRSLAGRLHPEIEGHIFEVTRRWMDPDGDGDPGDGIDGWRLDVAPDVPMPFWEAWRAHAKSINPHAVLLGEIWHDAAPWFSGRAFDGQMNYPFAMAVADWLALRPGMTSDHLAARLESVFSHAPQVDLVQMNLMGSHDTERLLSMLANPGGPTGRAYNERAAANSPGYFSGRPRPEVAELSILAAAIQVACPGAPMVYYGDEWAMTGANDPDCRKPVPWPDLGPPEDPDDAADPSVRDGYARWLRLRGEAAGPTGLCLRYGDARFVTTGSPDVLGLVRQLNGTQVVAALNRGAAADGSDVLRAAGVDPTAIPAAERLIPARSGQVWTIDAAAWGGREPGAR